MGSIINPNEKQTWAITAQGITVMGKTKSYNTYEEMLRSPDPGLINYVTDASGDPTVNSGFAVYRYANGIFTKVYEGEMMDPDLGMAIEWSKIINGPTSTPTDIDAAVEKTQPMEIQKDDTGRIVGLAVNGILLATEEQITELEGKTAGALHFKGVVENKEALPTEGNAQGDVYVDKEGKEYVYVDGTGFEEFGSITDLTNYYTKDEITAILATYLPLTNGVFSGLVYMEEAATTNAAQNIIVLGSNAIMNRVSIGQQDPTGFDADKLYSFKYFEAGPLGMKGFVDYLKSKGVSETITSAIRTNGVQIQDTGKKISDIPFYQTFQNSNDDAPRKTIQLANHDTISGIKTDGSGVNIAMVSKWDKVDLGSASIQLNLNSSDRPTLNDEDPIVVQSDLADYAKFEPNTSDPSRPDRKVLTLKNDDNICGYTTDGGSVNIAMVSKWDVADFGSTSVHMNLNSKDAITVNDKDTVLTDANYSEFITIPSLEGLATEESVRAQIAQEAEDRQAADSSLTAAVGLKQNALTVDGQKLTLTDDVLELGADVVVMQNPWDPNLPNRRHIVLKNHDSIVGTMTTGDNGSLIMMSKWDKVDIGTTKAQMNLNSPDGVIQVNDDAVVVTSANIGEYAPATDLSGYYTKVEVDQKIAGVLTYKGVLATVEELQSVEAPATGWVYHITATGAEYAWNGTEWEMLGSTIDLSDYVTTETLNATKAELTESIDGKVSKETGKSLVADTEIERLASVSNYNDAEVKADIASIKSDYATKTELAEYKVNLGAGTANTFVITNADGTIKASEYKLGGSSIAAEPNATTAATEQAVKTFVTNSVATKADTASFDVPSNIILVSSSVFDNEEGDTVCLDGYLGIVGTNTFATLSEAVAAASANDTIRIIGGQYIESPTIDKALKIYGVNNPSFAGRFAFSGDLSGTVLEGVEIVYAADANDTISHSVQYSTIGIRPTGDLGGFIIRNCRILTSGMATGIYVVGNDSDVVIENCEVIGGARNDGKTVASIVFQGNTHTAPVVKDCYLYGSVYFNSTTNSATVEGNTFCMVDSSAVSFAKKLSGNVIVRNNEFLSGGVNNAFKFNGSGTVGTNTGVDFTDLESLVIVDNYVAVNEAFVYMQAQTTAWDASKVTVENNRLFFSADAVMFKNEDSSVTYEFSASNVVLNEPTVQYDDSELQAAVDAVEKTADKANANVVSMSDRLVALEAQIVSLKQTDVAAVTSSADLAQADKDLIITIAEPITGTTTVEGKSIEVKQLTANNATTVFKTEGDVTMKNLTTTGDLPKTTANAQVRIVSGDYVRVTDSAINQTGYNAIEIGLGTGSGPSATKSIVIDNVKFNSTLTNNAISIFATEDGSVITISNCTFTKCSNPVRLSNATGGKVTINLVNCEFTEWDSDPNWAGILIMQDYTSGSEEAIKTNNLFGPDKVTINVINCTHAGEKIVAPANIADVCGTKDAATQLFYIWSNEEGFVTYDAERYPVINIQ